MTRGCPGSHLRLLEFAVGFRLTRQAPFKGASAPGTGSTTSVGSATMVCEHLVELERALIGDEFRSVFPIYLVQSFELRCSADQAMPTMKGRSNMNQNTRFTVLSSVASAMLMLGIAAQASAQLLRAPITVSRPSPGIPVTVNNTSSNPIPVVPQFTPVQGSVTLTFPPNNTGWSSTSLHRACR